ncbi:MAG: hypothetical protein K6L74_08815 [Neptuniibacter sp.]
MPIYKVADDQIIPIEPTTFSKQGLRERQDLQAMLKKRIATISPDTLVVAEEFGEWEDSRRRIDLLGIDKSANLVVIELKRTEDGGHMELQAIRYASMISTLTFSKLVTIYARYLSDNDIEADATESLLEFLDWNEPDEEQFAQEVKIVLASAEFSKELTTSVMWLNDFGLDIRCVRMRPYDGGGETLLDVQTVIPVPEVADYQVRIREKKQKEREARNSSRDFTKYDVSVGDNSYPAQSKRWMMFHIIAGILQSGGRPDEVISAIPWRRNRLFQVFDGELNDSEVYEAIMDGHSGGKVPRAKRFFTEEGEAFHSNGKTYVLTNQWGNRTLEAVESLSKEFPDLNICISPADAD